MRDANIWPDGECPHGFPARYVKRCADCRRERRRAEESAKFRAALARNLPDAAKYAANDREDDDQ